MPATGANAAWLYLVTATALLFWGQKARCVLQVFPLYCPCELADKSILCTSHSKQGFMGGLQSRQKMTHIMMQRRAVKQTDLSSLLFLSFRKLRLREGLFSACQSGCLLWEVWELLG